MPDDQRKFRFVRTSITLFALLVILEIAPVSLVHAQEPIRTEKIRDTRSMLVVGLREGVDDYKETYVELSSGKFLITPTKNGKPFHVTQFTRSIIEIKVKDARALPGRVSHIMFRFFDSEISLYRALLLEEVDFAQLSSESLVKEFERSKQTFQIYPRKKPPHTLEMIAYNLKHPILKSVAIRKAISHAIPVKRQIVEKVLFNKGEAARGGVFEPGAEIRPAGMEEYGYSRRKTVELLVSAGWTNKSNDRTRAREGVKLSLRLAYREGVENEEQIARRIALACKRVGIEVVPEKKTIRELKIALFTGDYEMALVEHQFEESRQAVYDFFGNPETSYIKFDDQLFQKLNALSENAENAGKTMQWLRSMQNVLNKKCVVSFLCFKWYDPLIINGAKFNAIDPKTGELQPLDLWRFRR